ncbi:tetraketide alpha-pyrone reductase 1-like [Vigna unguiculata]|uniref:tetraketide alpha-pyrone reductase 1-like n=1 Tax=Vigna unguiculata TaxID=3917 RepID=UPI001016700B|nr:tetraketide alpha-pyrone reductase 1-like [Vigna unguiculata]
MEEEEEEEEEKVKVEDEMEKLVCVTGASGNIGSWIVKLLLQRRYNNVRATVRDTNDPKKVKHLLRCDATKERLKLFKADLLEEGSFDSAVEGCTIVFHTASHFFEDAKDPQTELLDPAVKGTLNVLKSCAKSPTLKRVILTSCIAAVAFNERPKNPNVVVDETWYSDPEYCKRNGLWYNLSKTLVEDAAWKFAKENNIDLVIMNPGLVIGPLLPPVLNTSSAAILNLINGSQTFKNETLGFVDVRDVASAHLFVMGYPAGHPSYSGRYLLVQRVAHYSDIVKILRGLYPTLKLPEKCIDDRPYDPIFQVSKEKSKRILYFHFSFERILKDTVESLKEKKFIKF